MDWFLGRREGEKGLESCNNNVGAQLNCYYYCTTNPTLVFKLLCFRSIDDSM